MIFNRQRRVAIAVKPLDDFYQRVQHELRFPQDGVTICLISDAAMTRLNRAFRGKNAATDVLSFPATPGPTNARAPKAATNGHGSRRREHHERDDRKDRSDRNDRNDRESDANSYVGDIAISPETARRNARRSSRPLGTELRILILHGMIHLAGYDHESDSGQMERFESRLRRHFGLPR